MSEQESKYSADEIEKMISDKFWYHRIKLPHDIVTPGTLPFGEWHKDRYQVPENLEGLRVLDVGAWDGFWTFEAARRGAKEVIAIDDFSDYLGENVDNVERQAWENFDICKGLLGYSDEQVKRYDMSVYDLTEDDFGRFDIVMFFGVLYHLKYPLYALDKLAAVCDQAIYIETAVSDYYSPYRGFQQGYPGSQMVMEFYPDDQYSKNDTNWWAPTLTCLCHMVHSCGFRNIQVQPLTPEPTGINTARGYVQGFMPEGSIQPVPL